MQYACKKSEGAIEEERLTPTAFVADEIFVAQQ
jgi:hypothetical protein